MTAAGQALPKLECDLKPRQITVGDHVELDCAGMPPGAQSLKIDFSMTQEHEFAILTAPRFQGDSVHTVLTSYRVGTRYLTGLKLSADGKVYQINAPELKVESILRPSENGAVPSPYDITPPGEIPYPTWWWIMWGVILVAVFAGGVIAGYRRWKARRELLAKVPEKKLTPLERFETDLRKLDSKGLHRQGNFKMFALELTLIVKRALAEEFRFHADEMTTEELVAHLERRQKKFWVHAGAEARVLFEELDKIKFAKIPTRSEDCQKLLDAAHRIGRSVFSSNQGGKA